MGETGQKGREVGPLLAQSEEHVTQSQGPVLEPHVGCKITKKINLKENEEKEEEEGGRAGGGGGGGGRGGRREGGGGGGKMLNGVVISDQVPREQLQPDPTEECWVCATSRNLAG